MPVKARPDHAELLLAAIVESSDDAIISKDLNGIVTSWNPAAERIFGYSAEEMVGQPLIRIAAPDRLNEMPEILNRIRRGERVDHYETVRRAKDGRLIEVSLTVSPVYDSNGVIVGASKIGRDITERKAAEKIIADHVEKLARSNADLAQFAYIASHDLQEPLRTISAFSDLLRTRYKDKLDVDGEEFAGYVIQAADRMSDLIRDLLQYARTMNAELPMTDIDVAQTVAVALDNLRYSIQESGAAIDVGDMPAVHANRGGLIQVFQNLISNAIKYRAPGRPLRVEIGATREAGVWKFSVADNGAGIRPEYYERIFSMFRRLHGSQFPGTGIGLTLCKKIIEHHGGRIWVEQTQEYGVTFFFTIPV